MFGQKKFYLANKFFRAEKPFNNVCNDFYSCLSEMSHRLLQIIFSFYVDTITTRFL